MKIYESKKRGQAVTEWLGSMLAIVAVIVLVMNPSLIGAVTTGLGDVWEDGAYSILGGAADTGGGGSSSAPPASSSAAEYGYGSPSPTPSPPAESSAIASSSPTPSPPAESSAIASSSPTPSPPAESSAVASSSPTPSPPAASSSSSGSSCNPMMYGPGPMCTETVSMVNHIRDPLEAQNLLAHQGSSTVVVVASFSESDASEKAAFYEFVQMATQSARVVDTDTLA